MLVDSKGWSVKLLRFPYPLISIPPLFKTLSGSDMFQRMMEVKLSYSFA